MHFFILTFKLTFKLKKENVTMCKTIDSFESVCLFLRFHALPFFGRLRSALVPLKKSLFVCSVGQ